ncbi:MAG TPA: TetR/AcrR family transcriptional regulator [Acidimicrobiales bacterium]
MSISHPVDSNVRGPEAPSERRGEIAQAALELFATKGYRATTMADIGARLGIRGPSLYKHIGSKQELLVGIMHASMDRLLDDHRAAVATAAGVEAQLRRAVEAHVRFHTRHRDEAFVGTREIDSLDPAERRTIVAKRASYEQAFRTLIETGCAEGRFQVASSRLASYAILDMGMGVAVWFRADGPATADEVAYAHGDYALRLVGAD